MRLAVPGPCLRPAGRQISLIKATLSSSCRRVLQVEVGGRWEQGGVEAEERDALGISPHLALCLFFVGIAALCFSSTAGGSGT